MRLQFMMYILEIAKAGSLSKAASHLYITQQSLSDIVKSVENEIGFSVFNRSNKGITITEPGKHFLDDIQEIMTIADRWKAYGEWYVPERPFTLLASYYFAPILYSEEFNKWIEDGTLIFDFDVFDNELKRFQNDEKVVLIGLMPIHSKQSQLEGLMQDKSFIFEKSNSIPLCCVAKNNFKTITDDNSGQRDYNNLKQAAYFYQNIDDEKRLEKYIRNGAAFLPVSTDLVQFVSTHEGYYTVIPEFLIKKHILYQSSNVIEWSYQELGEEISLYIGYHATQKEKLTDLLNAIHDIVGKEHFD